MKPEQHRLEEKDYSFLESYEALDAEKDWDLVRNRMGFQKTRMLKPYWRVAALVIALLGMGILTQQLVLRSVKSVSVLAVEKGQEVNLPDGSLVVLNEGSVLTHPTHFRGRKRQVAMEGEAWFEVESDSRHPFVISVCDRAQVEVLGTKFNVNAAEDGEITVQVAEGKVAFSGEKDKLFRIVLNHGEQALQDEKGIRKLDDPDLNFLSWKTGILVFDQSPLAEIVDQLERYYGKKFHLDADIPADLLFSTTIDNQDLESVLEEMALVLDLDYDLGPESVSIFKTEE